jgi:hypothetical protein
MCDPAGVHITRIFVNYSRETPSPIRSTSTVPVHTSTPIINVGQSRPTPKQQMALLAREILANQRSSETFTHKQESPPSPPPAPAPVPVHVPAPALEEFVFISKESGQEIDIKTGDGIGRLSNPNPEAIPKKKKQRQSLAVVPPPASTRMYFKSNLIFYCLCYYLL